MDRSSASASRYTGLGKARSREIAEAMSSLPWFEDDELFEAYLREGYKWASMVAGRLRAAGLEYVELTPYKMRETFADRAEFRGEQDLRIRGMPIEVKSRNLRFSGAPGSYPFSTAFVGSIRKWERFEQRPVAVVLVSQFTGSMLSTIVGECVEWEEAETYDRIQKRLVLSHAVPRSCLVTFADLVEYLK